MERNTIPLREVQVRTVRPDEELRFDTLMREHHYLGFRKYCGHRLRQVAVHGERWLALLGWHAAALHRAARDRWIAAGPACSGASACSWSATGRAS